MSPLVQTILLVFAAGIVGFFIGSLLARWLRQPEAPAVRTEATQGRSREPASETAAAPAAAPAAPAMALAGAGPEKRQEPASAREPEIVGAGGGAAAAATLTAAPATPVTPTSAGMSAALSQTTGADASAAGSANPSVPPLRGPLAVRAAAGKATEAEGGKPSSSRRKPRSNGAGTPRRRVSAGKGGESAGGTMTSAPAKAASKPASKPAAAPAAAAGEARPRKPRLMEAPRKSGADDLKRIKGVGPGLEQKLNALGIYHYNQISKWTPQNVTWVDDQLRFKGRIERDGWVEQAGMLADGGVTDFAARADRKAGATAKKAASKV